MNLNHLQKMPREKDGESQVQKANEGKKKKKKSAPSTKARNEAGLGQEGHVRAAEIELVGSISWSP